MRITESQLRKLVRKTLREASPGGTEAVTETAFKRLEKAFGDRVKKTAFAIQGALDEMGLSHMRYAASLMRESNDFLYDLDDPSSIEQAVSILDALGIQLDSPEADEIYQKFGLVGDFPPLDRIDPRKRAEFIRKEIRRIFEVQDLMASKQGGPRGAWAILVDRATKLAIKKFGEAQE